ncbi:MAG: DNA recombination protein RmuC, partial [Elusimicrobiales bacterium]
MSAFLLTIIILLLAVIIFYVVVSTKNKEKELEKIKESISSLIQTILHENSRIRTEISSSLNSSIQSLTSTITQLTDINLQKLSEINQTLNRELKYLEEKNEKKLEEMRIIVDEKLHSTLEKRLSESFSLVSKQLESVYKGIGDMQRLASDVGDLKRVLTNVKQRGIFGELQLEKLLEDIMTKEQYIKNAAIKEGNFVEFAIKIPSGAEDEKYILLPIDSKYPQQDYERILDAQEKADTDALSKAVKMLEARILTESKDMHNKYINPPQTTDFAIMFLPVEGLFAEVLRIAGLFERVRKEYGVIITGPTTITAILNSLQMGFRTLAIEKKSHEVWKILAAVKTEFVKFGEYLSKTRKKLEDAANEIERAEKRTSII